MAKLDSLDLALLDGDMLLHKVPMQQQRVLGSQSDLSLLGQACSSIHSIAYALTSVEAVRPVLLPATQPSSDPALSNQKSDWH